jgi:hypothetical protein
MNVKNEDEMNETIQPEEMIVASQTETESLDDLAVENDSEVKGGPGGLSNGIFMNHNETTEEDEEETETESLDDLAVENDAEVKGGPNGFGGGIYLNHNETLADDQNVDDCTIIYLNAAARDLPATELAAGEVRGGIAKPAETKPALRPPPPQLPPDPPRPNVL